MSELRKLLGQSKIEAALRGSSLMGENDLGLDRFRCRARKRVYIGQGVMGGTWLQCSKHPRPGKKTCHWHQHLEG
jgi:hypothetical protein